MHNGSSTLWINIWELHHCGTPRLSFYQATVSCARQDLKSSQAYPRGFAEALQTVIGDNLHEIRSTQQELQIAAACITMKRDDVFDMGSKATAHDKWFDANLHGVFQQLLAHRK